MGTGANAGGSIIDGNGTVIQGVNSRKNAEGSILGNNGKSPEGTIMGANAKNAEGSIIGGITKKNATGSIMGVVKNNLVTTTEEPVLDEYGEPIVEYNEDGTPKAPVFSEKKTMVVAAKQGNVLGITPNGKAGHTSRIVRPGIQQHNGNAIGVDNTGHAGHPSGIMRGTIKAKEDGSVAIAGARPSKMAHVAAEIGNKGNTVGIHGGHPSGIMRGYAKKEASGIGESHPSGIMRGAVKADVNGIGESHPSGIMRGTVKKDGNAVGESHPSKIMRGTVDATKSTTMMDYAAKVGSHPSGMMRGIQADKMNLPQGDKIGLAQGSKLGFAQSDKIDLSKSEKGGHPSNILRTGAPTKKAGNPIPSGEKGGHPSNILRAQIKEKNGHPSHLLVKAARLDKSGHPSQMMRQGFSQPVTLTASLAEPSSFDNRAAPIALIANNAPMLSQPKLQRDIMIPAVKTSPIIPPKSNGGMLGGLLAQRGFNIPEARHTPIPSPPPSLMSPSVSYNTVVTPSPNTDPRTGMIPDVIKGDKVKLGLSFGGAPEVKKESLIGSKIL
jgi:hypothetical protein